MVDSKTLNKELMHFIKKSGEKIRGDFLSISEKFNGLSKTLKIKSVYSVLREKNVYILKIHNFKKVPKYLYYLAISLASQSSDFLVMLAQGLARKNQLRLIQYAIRPKNYRINLLGLKELKDFNEYEKDLELLKNLRQQFRRKLEKFKDVS